MADSIKNKTVKGLLWSGGEKFSMEIIHFIISVIVARLLMPSDYGAIGIMMVFTSFSMLFIDGGLTTALIQKTNRTEDDFNTAFIYNLVVSVFVYLVLFLCSPLIANWYERPELTSLLRVLSLNLIISSFASVQNTKLTIAMDFKKISIISFVSGIASGVVSLIMAYSGFGVWALVFQQLVGYTMRALLLNIYSHWIPKLRFSKESFHELFSFGYKLILTNLLARVYSNLYPLIIGKLYPFKTLGYYTRGQQYATLPQSILNDMFLKVSFPAMSTIKSDNRRLYDAYRRYITVSSSIIFPVMFLIIVVAKPLILVMLTEKWEPAYPFLQIFCLGKMFEHISAINLNLLFVKGRSDLALKLEVLKKTVAITILVISTFWGIWGICIGQTLYCILATFLNSIYTKRIINLGYVKQVQDFGVSWVVALFSAALAYIPIFLLGNNYAQMVICIILFTLFYLIGSKMFNSITYDYCVTSIKEQIVNRKK